MRRADTPERKAHLTYCAQQRAAVEAAMVGVSVVLGNSLHRFHPATLAEAQDVFVAFCTMQGLEPVHDTHAQIYAETGDILARITPNGRVWAGDAISGLPIAEYPPERDA